MMEYPDPVQVFWKSVGVVEHSDELAAVIFGSAVLPGFPWRDIDIWIDGPERLVANLAGSLATTEIFDVCVAHEYSAGDPRAAALQWHASQGLAVIGKVPDAPPLTWGEVVRIFQGSARDQAGRLVMEAREAIRLGHVKRGAELSESAVRSYLRSLVALPQEWRALSRLDASRLIPAVARVVDRRLARQLRNRGYDSRWSIERLAALIEEARPRH